MAMQVSLSQNFHSWIFLLGWHAILQSCLKGTWEIGCLTGPLLGRDSPHWKTQVLHKKLFSLVTGVFSQEKETAVMMDTPACSLYLPSAESETGTILSTYKQNCSSTLISPH